MGRKFDVASFLCGALSRKKPPPPKQISDGNPQKDDIPISATPPPQSPENSPEKPSTPIKATPEPPSITDEEELINRPLQPPPGRLQPQLPMRAASYNQNRSKTSGLSKLSASLSVRAASKRVEDIVDKNKKKLKHDDSIWKKTIILGEKCRVPDEDDDTILYDENGNRISAYHPKNNVVGGSMRSSVSRQNSGNSCQGLAVNEEL